MLTRNPMKFLHMGCGEPLLRPVRGFVERRHGPAAQQSKPSGARKRKGTDR